MKKFTLLFLLLGFAFSIQAQNYNVTFQVDMSNENPIADSVTVAGNFQAAAVGQGWTDWTPGISILDDSNMDSVYTMTIQLPAGSYEYKYLNGTAWGTDESVPGACQVNGNRGFTVSNADLTIPVHCFASCDPCAAPSGDTADVTFLVDMSNETVGDTVSIAGSVQGAAVGMGWSDWTPGQTVLTDANMDNVYEITFRLPAGTYQYKFINGTAWGQDESVPSGCAVNNNREVVVSGTAPITVPVVCFGTCDAMCTPPLPPIAVTFQLDMTDEIVNSSGVYVAGSFQNPSWVKDTLEMMDANADGIYTFTDSIVPGEYQYKFFNGDCGDPCGETANFEMLGCGVPSGVGGYNRILDIQGMMTDTVLPPYKWNTCEAPTGIEETNPAFFNLYPNPMNAQAVVEFNNANGEAFDLTITSITGQVMNRVEGIRQNRAVIERNRMASGLYFVTLSNKEGMKYTRKIIIE